MATGNDFEVDYDFHGMLPWYAAPIDTVISHDGAVSTTTVSMSPWTSARYIRILGVKRATRYGISLYELEAYGPLASMTDDDIQGVKISADADFLKQGQSAQLYAKAYTFGG